MKRDVRQIRNDWEHNIVNTGDTQILLDHIDLLEKELDIYKNFIGHLDISHEIQRCLLFEQLFKSGLYFSWYPRSTEIRYGWDYKMENGINLGGSEYPTNAVLSNILLVRPPK